MRPICDAALVNDRLLVISMPVQALAHAARNSEYFFNCAEDGMPLVITDEVEFAQSVVNALNNEQEDGSTPITRMLDDAFIQVCEMGDPGVEEERC